MSPRFKAWCAHVIVNPDHNKIAVFNKGTLNGSNGTIPTGGHMHPICGVGAKLEWKNAQKKAMKNITSETINKKTPIFIPLWTTFGWNPCQVDSRITSLHQRNITRKIVISPNKLKSKPIWKKWKYMVNPNVKNKAPMEPKRGQGLGVTIWYKCLCLLFNNIQKRYFINSFVVFFFL